MLNQEEISKIYYSNPKAAKALDTIGIITLVDASNNIDYALSLAEDESTIKILKESKTHIDDLCYFYEEPETVLIDKWRGYDEAFVATPQTIEDANKELKALHII